jgi:hypothetical protein
MCRNFRFDPEGMMKMLSLHPDGRRVAFHSCKTAFWINTRKG